MQRTSFGGVVIEQELHLWSRYRKDYISGALSSDTLDELVESKLLTLTVEQKVAQLIQAELASVTPEDVREFGLGSILNGGGVFPNGSKFSSVEDWRAIANAFHDEALESSSGIPLLWGTDAVHGHNNVYGATLFPHNIGLGAANDADLMLQIGQHTALDLHETGIDWVFAPTLAIPQDFRWGRTYEGYSQDPQIVARLGSALIRGIQGDPNSETFFDITHVLATSKHFVGEGAAIDGIDQGNTECSEAELREIHAVGHIHAIASGVQVVMAAFNSWRGQKLHGHRYLLQDVLKGQLGFRGFVVSDWDGFAQLDSDLATSCIRAVNAGIDMLMVSSDWRQIYDILVQAIEQAQISNARLDDAVRRILRVKMVFDLRQRGPVLPQARGIRKRYEFGDQSSRLLAREAVHKSLVLLKNDDDVLPLQRNQRVLVVGDFARNVGKQCGGWTLTWQGTGNENGDFPSAYSIAEGIESIVNDGGGEFFFADDIEEEIDVDVAFVVFGENPYAEGEGDINHLSFGKIDHKPVEQMKKLRVRNIPVVALFITGRPLWINPELNEASAFVVCWLPGSQAGAVANVLFRGANDQIDQDFHGRLPFAWPLDSTITGVGELANNPSAYFPLGYGLSYEEEEAWIDLAEEDETEGPSHRGFANSGSYNYPQ